MRRLIPISVASFALLFVSIAIAQHTAPAAPDSGAKPKPEDTEIWTPEPAVVTPATVVGQPPSDALILFNGKNLDEWVSAQDHTPARWTLDHDTMKVSKEHGVGNIETKRRFKNYQLHIEFKIPKSIQGEGQGRGNSGVFLASTGPGDAGYELQVLDNYNNKTYVNGMVGSLYKQAIPLANASRKPGEWESYDIIWTAPTFSAGGELQNPAFATVFFNGVLVENHFQLQGQTLYIGKPFYQKYDSAPIKLQAHGDKSEPLSFRNIWVRDLP